MSLGAGYPAEVVMFLGFENQTFLESSSLLSFDPLYPKHKERKAEDRQGDIQFLPPTAKRSWCYEAAFYP